MSTISVREFATLRVGDGPSDLDRASISQEDFAWLAGFAGTEPEHVAFVRVTGARTLQVRNYVGVLRTPSGQDLEILPKHTADAQSISGSRRLLRRMISETWRVTPKMGGEANLEVFDRPFTEWLASLFLQSVRELVGRGLRSAYVESENQERYLRGRLNLVKQLRAGPSSAATFHIRQDVFTLDRPENRLIRAALDRVVRGARAPDNWRLARELAERLAEIPPSHSIKADLQRWRSDRLMAGYAALRPLCEAILTDRTPFALSGARSGLSLLFPMERLFEDFVESSVRKQLPLGYTLHRQPKAHTLCRYGEKRWFELRPDLVVCHGDHAWVVDAKWKLLHGDPNKRFGISQSDLYQMHAYGQTYLSGLGELCLVYPGTAQHPLLSGPLLLPAGERLRALSLDLETGAFDRLPWAVAS